MSAPWEDALPTSVEIGGAEYEIRTDYRDILNVFALIGDPELDAKDKAISLLVIFYPGIEDMPESCYDEAIKKCYEFINCEDADSAKPSPKLMDWEQDFKYVVAPINRVLGQEVRSIPYMHWWTFIAAYYEIGDCLFAQIVRIRNFLAKGKQLSKDDRKWYNENRHLVDFKTNYTDAEKELLKKWGVK